MFSATVFFVGYPWGCCNGASPFTMYLPLGRFVVVAAACMCHLIGLAPPDEYGDAGW